MAAFAAREADSGADPDGRTILAQESAVRDEHVTTGMPFRSRTSMQKRQKEALRAEKQREKAAKRLARKSARKEGDGDVDRAQEIADPNGEHPD